MDVKFEIVQKLGVLSETEKGWTKELNIVSWNNAAPKFDIRSWDVNHEKKGKGVTLTRDEAEELYELLGQALKKWL